MTEDEFKAIKIMVDTTPVSCTSPVTKSLVLEVERLRSWLRVRFVPLGDFVDYDFGRGDGPGSWAKEALDGEPAPADDPIVTCP